MEKRNSALRLENLPRTISLEWGEGGKARFVYVDQRELPGQLVRLETESWEEVVDAIKELAVRGAPAIGVSGAAALALWVVNGATDGDFAGIGSSEGSQSFDRVASTVSSARPTAVNLAWGVSRIREKVERWVAEGATRDDVVKRVFDAVKRMEQDDEATNRAIGANGAALLPERCSVLTHCNAGSLATVFYGTALGVVYAAAEQGKIERVYSDETRPVGQGSRLTVWELSRAGVPATLQCDNMAASLMAQGRIDAVVVGADRIAANGDTANKIGTYGVAVLARHHGIPFYVAAPFSTIDASLSAGDRIPIEQRRASEATSCELPGVEVYNPAFDVTPAALIDAIITEKGCFAPGELCSVLKKEGVTEV